MRCGAHLISMPSSIFTGVLLVVHCSIEYTPEPLLISAQVLAGSADCSATEPNKEVQSVLL